MKPPANPSSTRLPVPSTPREPFIPFTTGAAAPAPGGQDFRFHVVPQAPAARSFIPAGAANASAPHLPDLGGACAAGRGEPRITLHREGERVARISIQCGCGQVIELACVY